MRKTDVVQLRVRIRGELLSKIRAEAKRKKMAPNEELIARLEDSFKTDERIADLRQRLDDQKQRVADQKEEYARGKKELHDEYQAIMKTQESLAVEIRTLNEKLELARREE
jgi:hypothetical protein